MVLTMTKGPSIKNLIQKLNLTLDQAKEVKHFMQTRRIYSALDHVNTYLNGYGVESCREYHNFMYVNMGNIYNSTLCYTGKIFIISSYGNYKKRHAPLK